MPWRIYNGGFSTGSLTVKRQTGRLFAILRRPEGLFAVIGRRSCAFERPMPPTTNEKADGDSLQLYGQGPYVEETLSLANVPIETAPGRDSLIASWDKIRAVESFNSEITACVLHILNETVADPFAGSTDVCISALDESSRPCHPTAAHPRAYRGTKYRPAKRPKVGPIDLHSILCSVFDFEPLFTMFDKFLDEANERLNKIYQPFELVPHECQNPFQHDKRWHSLEFRKRVGSLPAHFQHSLFWNLRRCDWETVAMAVSAYWSLRLEQNCDLRHCVSALLSIQPGRRAVDWCRVISKIQSVRRIHFTELLIESGACSIILNEEIVSGLMNADSLSGDSVYRHRMFYALSNVNERCQLSYANDGFLLANEYCVNTKFTETGSLGGVASSVRPFAEYVSGCEDWWDCAPMDFWKRCSELEGFKELLDYLDWRHLDPQSAFRFFRLLGRVVFEELGEKKLKRKWQCIRQHADFMLNSVKDIPVKYRPKMLEGLEDILWVWDDPKKLGNVLAPFTKLLTRLCLPPFKEWSFCTYPLTSFTALQADDWSIIQEAESSSFLKLESIRKNESLLITQGLRSLCDILPRLVTTGFVSFPEKLFKAAHTIGTLAAPLRREIIQAFTRHPLAKKGKEDISTEDLLLVEEHLRPGISNPIPRRLRDYLKGQRVLKPAQVERDIALVGRSWIAFQLDLLDQTALNRVSLEMPPVQQTSQIRHALLIQQTVEEHRRSLRRLLVAYLGGNRKYAEQHPKNRQWLSRHPKIDPEKWINGVVHSGEAAGQGIINLSVEQDALEVLRLGSYFGTCLGLGGALSYSAAAVTLDINKQVVYARNIAGRVIARQLLAISEDDILVCFSVYPTRTTREVRALFREYDLKLAAFLGLPIFRMDTDAGHSYEISPTISRDFWDDDAWDLNTDNTESG